MKIPVVFKSPYSNGADDIGKITQIDQILLKSLGFDLSKIEGKKYNARQYIDLPNNLECKEEYLDFGHRVLTIFKDGSPAISINQKLGYGINNEANEYVRFYIKNVYEDLEQKKQKKDVNSEFQQTPFQEAVISQLGKLESCITEAPFGHGKYISEYLNILKKHSEESPEEFKKIIASNTLYQKLYVLFPNWQDVNHIQAFCEKQNVGFVMAASGPQHVHKPIDNLVQKYKRQEALANIEAEVKLSIKSEYNAPLVTQLKKLCFEYADEVYQSVIHPYHYPYSASRLIADAKIEALNKLWSTLNSASTIESDKGDIETVFNGVKDILKKDSDLKALHFLKEFGRILQAVFTLTYKTRQQESLQVYGTLKFWKSPDELRAKKFIKEVRAQSGITKLIKTH